MTTRALFRSLLILLIALASSAVASDFPQLIAGDYVIKNFKFGSGESIPELRIHYRTVGTLRKGADGHATNAVLVMHGTTGSGENFLGPGFAGFLFVPGGLLDAAKYYVVMPDGIGHGRSSKPSDGLHQRFPHYGYNDMVEADYRLLTEHLGVDHLRLVMGTSMGGMHTWVWGEKYPAFMDALLPLASLPVQISGRNLAWRKMVVDAIRSDPGFQNGDYKQQPRNLAIWIDLLWLMSSNPVQRQKEGPTRVEAARMVDDFVQARLKGVDANDVIYALEASHDYDPEPRLGAIRAPLLAINFQDDLINPPELGLLEMKTRLVPRGRAVVIPRSDATRGHGTHTMPAIYKDYLAGFLKQTER